MYETVRGTVGAHLEDALGKPVDIARLTDDTALNSLGLDSLLTISALVALAEDCGADLGDYADTLVAPQTVGDLVAMTEQFMADAPA